MRNERMFHRAVILSMALGSLCMAIALSAPTLKDLFAPEMPPPCPCQTDRFHDANFDDGLTRAERVTFVRNRIRSTVSIYVDNYSPKKGLFDSVATGVIIDEDGTVLTANHVIDEADFVQVGILDLDKAEEIVETRYIPMYVDAHLEEIDAAVLKPVHREENLPAPMRVAADWKPVNGALLWHFGQTTEFSQGHLTATTFSHFLVPIKEPCMTLHANGDFGDSGGPVVTSKGELVGILVTISTTKKEDVHFMPVSTIMDKLPMSCH